MPANALIQTRIDRDLKDRAAAILDTMGLTISDAVRILLTRIAHEGRLPFELAADREAYVAWFRAKVYEALLGEDQDVLSEQIEAAVAAPSAAVSRKAQG